MTDTNSTLSTNSTLAPTPTTAQIYGYGTIAIAFISGLSLLGVCLLPCMKKKIYEKVLIVLTGLAIGTLICDAVLHILPDLFKMSLDASDDTSVDSSKIVIKASVPFSCVILFTIYVLWILQTVSQKLAGGNLHSHGHSHDHSHGHSHGHPHGHPHELYQVTPNSYGGLDTTDSDKKEEIDEKKRKQFCYFKAKNIKNTAWILMCATIIHNLCDGLAVGASFAISMSTGLSTSIAIVCHEIPHEIGDYALYIRFGFNHKQALFINFLTSISCFIGFYIGASIGDTSAPDWILCVTAGTFIYISLVELIPSLPFHDSVDWSWALFICVNLAMLTGFGIMFLLVIFEDYM